MQFEKWLDFDTNPLYALLHEPIYCQVDIIIFFLFTHSLWFYLISDSQSLSLCRVLLIGGLLTE